MAALGTDRNSPRRDGVDYQHPVAASTKIYAGAIVMRNATGYATKGATSAGLKPLGVAHEQADNSSGADGAITVNVKVGVFRFANDGSIARLDIGKTAYVVDDQTVADSDNVGARSPLGKIVDVDSVGVWVHVQAPTDLNAIGVLDFASMNAAASADLTIAVLGAEVGDRVSLGLPAAPTAGIIFQAFVSSAGVVTVRATNITAGAVDPASASYTVTVHKS